MSEDFRTIGIVGQPRYEGLDAALGMLGSIADERGLTLFAEPDLAPAVRGADPFEPGDVDLLLTFGGDGTLLRGARMVAPFHTPVLGVNMGHLGFLTSVPPEELDTALEAIFRGEYWLDSRFTLEARVVDGDGEQRSTYLALNDAVLHKGGFARVIRLRMHVGDDGEEVAEYSADGIILSTPTGSTAYSLSAGGAIVYPTVDCILATPICPHTLAVRPLIIPAQLPITVEVRNPSEEVVLTVDGQEGEALSPGECLIVRRGDAIVPLVRFPEQSFFSTLRRKLHWGAPGKP